MTIKEVEERLAAMGISCTIIEHESYWTYRYEVRRGAVLWFFAKVDDILSEALRRSRLSEQLPVEFSTAA